jgi:cobaltochelatase CobN
VTWRISGLFRDLFPAQIALLDAAVRAVAAREESAEENPLAADFSASATGSSPVVRIFGTAPGAYGAGVEDFLGRDLDRAQVGSAYLAAVSHSYGGSDGVAAPAPGAFEARVATADMLVHSTEDPVRDLLEGFGINLPAWLSINYMESHQAFIDNVAGKGSEAWKPSMEAPTAIFQFTTDSMV